MITKTTEYLKYEFTRAEINEHALNLARKNQELAELDLRQKHLQADINAGKKAANETIAQLAGWISHGHDYRMISCVIKFNDPVDGKKTIYRENSYEWVKTVDMDASEIAETKQADLPFDGTPCDACSGQGVQPISGHPTCLVCGGSGKQLEEVAASATNGAPAANGTAPEESTIYEPGTVVDAEALEAEAASGPAIASQAEMSRAAKGKR